MSNWIYRHRDNKGWRSARAGRLLRVALWEWIRSSIWDFTDFVRFGILKEHLRAKPAAVAQNAAPKSYATPPPVWPTTKPVVFASYAVDQKWIGSHRYCGGEKCLNALVHLLRGKGYEAYLVTTTGEQAGWLSEAVPTLSVEEFKTRRAQLTDYRCVSSWIDAHAFLDGCDKFYYWDMELATASDYQFPRLWDYAAAGRIVKFATLNRAVQAWFLTVLQKPSEVIPCLIDSRHWLPAEERRVRNRVGYMDEGAHTEELVAAVRAQAETDGLAVEFLKIAGDEPKVIAEMQTCEIFLVTNAGKSAVWGEGGPLGPYESAACGTVPVCFDLLGPWESLQQNYNGIVLPRGRFDLMAQAVSALLRDRERLKLMSGRALDIFRTAHSMEARWPRLQRFLDLPED